MKISFFATFFLFSFLCAEERIPVLVSIFPQKFLVEQIGGEFVEVQVIVPPGTSPHSYEPTVRQTLALQKRKVWFRLGEGFENRLLKILSNSIEIIDQRKGISLLPLSCCHCHEDAYDSHIWLSPKLLKIQSQQITDALCKLKSECTSLFQQRLEILLKELDHLDQKITSLLDPLQERSIFVSHPAFGYFCRDYQLEQLSIEMEGKEPSPRYLTTLVNEAKKRNAKTFFLQMQYNPKGGEKLAQILNAKTVYLDPYAEDVLTNLKEIAEAFAQK